ncbi:ABCB family ABC transporter ATP-binding protein/permease [Bartonella krasnovii]|uniref:ABC transporter ATP-binding protein/permease n=1 Tax=Bartonella krasnovii TaxID=2267275 RepID=A0A5B9CZX8_9HYPH|nr:ABC transporter ATP-binding protein/permease [Bartonella krasnovii]QEE11817.1 ABC transporter ATP-binding protein/permease [Bartonella krasnovii]UNF29583.1 ABC transporter ATP-binding protein/permease [Bartonella krasnovii]UNF35941.1 ABC transporter ATP-binding protein/permease [Bartonella krasnovii]UNF37553.1 ABC transporter ATP-binding protein/permease [Bartonella krasnovii]UNF39336.1 ABC transporter ATP-binding protein/permease [Bartonella krasnovii]
MKRNEMTKTVSSDTGKTLHTLYNLWPYMWPADRRDLKIRVLWAIFYLILSKLVLISVPYFFKYSTNLLDTNFQLPEWFPSSWIIPIMLVLAYNIARIVQAGLNQLRDSLFATVGQHAIRQLAYKTFVHIHELSLRFHLERRTGGLSRVIERGTKGIEAIVRFSILNTVPTILEFILTALVFYINYGWHYLLIVVATVFLYTFFTIKASDWRIRIRQQMNTADTEANTRAVDSLLNFETVKYFGNETLEADRFDNSMAGYEKAATKIWTSLSWLNFGQALIFGIGMTIMMLMSAYEVFYKTQTLGDFVFINALLMQLSIPLNFIGSIYRDVRQGLTDIEAMFDLLDVQQEIVDKSDAKPLEISDGTIRFHQVKFSYDSMRQILRDIDFEVPGGKTVAIVGPSGAGKSTISRLLFRFYDVDAGSITIDGQDIRDITQKSLREAIGMVPQDTVLFNDTIAYNIRYGRPSATDEEMHKAAEMAQISKFIEILPEGFQSMVGERGLKLSGGEKQRVAIARTLLKAPPLLILDEATAALDTATEQEIQQALDIVSRGRTTLIIAHRLSTVINADEILVLKSGRIIENGTHTELLRKKGLYASMWNKQLEASQAEEKLRKMREQDETGIVSRKK